MRTLFKKQIVLSEEQNLELGTQSWLNNSHYWNDSDHITICLWCNKIQPIQLDHSTLCLSNPHIIELIK